VGGLLNATLGNLTELVIALSALRAGQYMLVKASSAGAQLSLGLSLLLIVAYGLGLVFSLKTHREMFGSTAHAEGEEALGLVRRSAGVDGLFDPSRCSRAPGSG
jgi:Ca2+/H+ antiporter